MSNLCTCVECMPDSQEPEMSNEEKMREEFNKLYGAHFEDTKLWKSFLAVFSRAWKACAAIKDAEIEGLQASARYWQDRAGQFSEEIAARDLMIKELRERVIGTSDYLEACGQSDSVEIDLNNEALANSEHHNSRALEKMLLEAELKGLENIAGREWTGRRQEVKASLAELNKEK